MDASVADDLDRRLKKVTDSLDNLESMSISLAKENKELREMLQSVYRQNAEIISKYLYGQELKNER